MSAISLFEEKQVRRAWNASEEKWDFSIDDVVLVLTDSANVKDYIKKLRKRDSDLYSNRGTNCLPVEMIAADGKHHMTDLELIFTMLGEASTTEIAKKRDAKGFSQNHQAAHAGGTVAGNARRELESQSGKRIPTKNDFKALPGQLIGFLVDSAPISFEREPNRDLP